MRVLALAAVCTMLLPSLARAAEAPPGPGPAPAAGSSAPAAGATPAGVPDGPGPAGAEPEDAPPGSAADQALWRATYDVSNRVQLQRVEANKLQWELRRARLDERLAAAAKGAPPEEAAALDDLRRRFTESWARNYEILTGRWPVDPTRVCLYPKLLLESAMRVAEGPDKGPQVAEARDGAQRCVETATLAVGRLEASTKDLRALAGEAERRTARAPLPAGGGEATGPSATAAPQAPGKD